jgi:hypothetical protein
LASTALACLVLLGSSEGGREGEREGAKEVALDVYVLLSEQGSLTRLPMSTLVKAEGGREGRREGGRDEGRVREREGQREGRMEGGRIENCLPGKLLASRRESRSALRVLGLYIACSPE